MILLSELPVYVPQDRIAELADFKKMLLELHSKYPSNNNPLRGITLEPPTFAGLAFHVDNLEELKATFKDLYEGLL